MHCIKYATLVCYNSLKFYYTSLVWLLSATTSGERSFQLCREVERQVRTSPRSEADSTTQTCSEGNSFSSERTARHPNITEEKVSCCSFAFYVEYFTWYVILITFVSDTLSINTFKSCQFPVPNLCHLVAVHYDPICAWLCCMLQMQLYMYIMFICSCM